MHGEIGVAYFFIEPIPKGYLIHKTSPAFAFQVGIMAELLEDVDTTHQPVHIAAFLNILYSQGWSQSGSE